MQNPPSAPAPPALGPGGTPANVATNGANQVVDPPLRSSLQSDEGPTPDHQIARAHPNQPTPSFQQNPPSTTSHTPAADAGPATALADTPQDLHILDGPRQSPDPIALSDLYSESEHDLQQLSPLPPASPGQFLKSDISEKGYGGGEVTNHDQSTNKREDLQSPTPIDPLQLMHYEARDTLQNQVVKQQMAHGSDHQPPHQSVGSRSVPNRAGDQRRNKKRDRTTGHNHVIKSLQQRVSALLTIDEQSTATIQCLPVEPLLALRQSTATQKTRHKKDDNTAYGSFQRNSQEPPCKRQEIEAPQTKLAHLNAAESNDQSKLSQSVAARDQSNDTQSLDKNQYGSSNVDDNANQSSRGQFQSKRALDFSNQKAEVQDPTVLTKLNEVQFPNHVGQTPYTNKIPSRLQAAVPNTPITEIMKLRDWHKAKIKRTQLCFDENVLPAQKLILSQNLLDILQVGNDEKEKEFNKRITSLCSSLIDKIILGLARKQIEGNSQQPRRQQSMQLVLDADEQGDEDVQMHFQQLKEKHFENIFGMTAQLLEKIFQTHHEMGKVAEVKKLIHSELFIKSIVICTAELQFFIHDVHGLQCCEVTELIEQPPFDFWRILSIFLKIYPDLPRRISAHFREIELRIVSFLAWKKGSSVLKILEFMKQQAHGLHTNGQPHDLTMSIEEQRIRQLDGLSEKQRQKLVPYNCFFSRVLQASASIIVELCNMLKINPEYQEVVWSISKCMLSCEPNLLMERHVHQLVMCTIYSVAKISDLRTISFNSIINRYAYLYDNAEYVTQIYTHCVVNQETGETRDIINFYNEVYLKKMTQYIRLYKDQCRKIKQALDQKAMQARESYANNARSALTPGTNGHMHANQSILGITKPAAQAILTPVGTKMIIRALCPQTPLYEQLHNQKMSSNMRIVVSRGQKLSFDQDPHQAPLQESNAVIGHLQPSHSINVPQINTSQSFPIEDYEKQNQKNYFKSVVESNQHDLNQNVDPSAMETESHHRKTVSQSNLSNMTAKNSGIAMPGKPPRPSINAIYGQHPGKNMALLPADMYAMGGAAQNKMNCDQNDRNGVTNFDELGKKSIENAGLDDNSHQSMCTQAAKKQQPRDEMLDCNQVPAEATANCANQAAFAAQSAPQAARNTHVQGFAQQTSARTMAENEDAKLVGNPNGTASAGGQAGAPAQMRMNILNKIKKNCANADNKQQ